MSAIVFSLMNAMQGAKNKMKRGITFVYFILTLLKPNNYRWVILSKNLPLLPAHHTLNIFIT